MSLVCVSLCSSVQVSIGEDGGVTIKGLFSEAKVVTADVEAGDASEWRVGGGAARTRADSWRMPPKLSPPDLRPTLS